jgi:hypothetical protein
MFDGITRDIIRTMTLYTANCYVILLVLCIQPAS